MKIREANAKSYCISSFYVCISCMRLVLKVTLKDSKVSVKTEDIKVELQLSLVMTGFYGITLVTHIPCSGAKN